MELIVGLGKSWEIKVKSGTFVAAHAIDPKTSIYRSVFNKREYLGSNIASPF